MRCISGALLGLALGGCGAGHVGTLDSREVGHKIRVAFRTLEPGERFNVRCPAGIPVKQGRGFHCRITMPGRGRIADVLVRQTDGSGKFDCRTGLLRSIGAPRNSSLRCAGRG